MLTLALGLQFLLPYKGAVPEAGALAVRRPRPVTIPLLPEYSAILKAPLFAPDRKPGETGVSANGAAGTLTSYAALGAATGRGIATAIVSGPGNAVKTLKIGDEVDGWRLSRVTTTKLTFERNGVEHVLVIGEPAEALAKAPATDAAEGEQQ